MALLVDGVDGTLARRVGVEEKAPNLDGIILDSIIDYLNYVINPALMIYWFQMVPSGLELILPALIFGVSLYTFIFPCSSLFFQLPSYIIIPCSS